MRGVIETATQALLRLARPPATALFHGAFYDGHAHTWESTTWLGTPAKKCPFDLWMYQEMLAEQRPDLIVETGTAHGGSALFLASVCDLLDHGEVITVDIEHRERPQHPRITYLHGSSTAPEIVEQVRARAEAAASCLVLLDSDHAKAHVLRELELYAPLVTVGSYLVVEDTNVNGHPVARWHGPGPHEAVQEFLSRTAAFQVDRHRERLLLTFNPGGYLRRVRPG
jgi:cephalosporin hydroxylase